MILAITNCYEIANNYITITLLCFLNILSKNAIQMINSVNQVQDEINTLNEILDLFIFRCCV